jgi:hypothetical protein
MKKGILLLLSLIVLSFSFQTFAQDENQAVEEKPVIKKELTKAEKDSILYEKLSSDQLLELKKHEMEVEKKKIEAKSKLEMPLDGLAIIAIVISPFAFVILIILLNIRHKNKESQRRYELYMKSLEMGQTVPEHFFDQPKQNGKKNNLQRGIILLMVGISFGLFVIIQNRNDLPFLLAAIIPSFLGIGYLLIHFLEKPKKEIAGPGNEQN